MMQQKDIIRHRRALYFDCICGTTSAIISLTAIFVWTPIMGIPYPAKYATGVGFWLFILGISLFLIGIGVHGFYLEKKYPEGVPTKKKIKAPIR